jgi:hypothetical protein
VFSEEFRKTRRGILEGSGRFWKVLEFFRNILEGAGSFRNILEGCGTFWNILEGPRRWSWITTQRGLRVLVGEEEEES